MGKRKVDRQRRIAPGAAAPALDAQRRDGILYEAALAFREARLAEAESIAQGLHAQAAGFFPVLLLRGMIAARDGRAEEGIGWLREAVELEPHSIEARNELATLLRLQGQAAEAVTHAARAVRLAPGDPGSRNNLGMSLLADGRVPQAIGEFERAIALKPDAAAFHCNLGFALRQQSRDLEAMAAFGRALEHDPANAEALASLGPLLQKHGQPAEAARCFERAAARQRDSAVAAVQRAEARMAQGRAPEAEQYLRDAIAADPRSDFMVQALGVLLQRLGRFEEAEVLLERAIELQPRRAASWASLVQGRRIGPADGRIIDAIQSLLADARLPVHERCQLRFALGKAYEDLGEFEPAMRQFDKANEELVAQMRRAGRAFDRAAHREAVDAMIGGLAAGCFTAGAGEGSDSELPVLVVGMPRSGTTLVEQILSCHPQAGGAGELTFWTDRQALCGAALARTLVPGQASGLAEEYLALLRAMAPSGRARIVDKMPANFLMLGLIRLALPRARIIHCRRHAVDTCLSIFSTPLGSVVDFAHDRADLAFYWEQYARLMFHWRRAIPAEQLFEVDYEALVAEPERVTRALVRFCGLPWDDACLHPERSAHVIMTPSLWQARQPVYRSAVARWRRFEPWLGEFRRLLEPAAQ